MLQVITMRKLAWALLLSVAWSGASAMAGDGQSSPALAGGSGSNDAAVRRQVALDLFDLGPGAKSALPALTALAADEEPDIRLLAVATLARIGPQARPAAGTLAGLLDDPDEGIRQAAMEALYHLGPGTAPALAEVAENGTWQARVNANRLLELLEEETVPPVPVLVAELNEQDWSIRETPSDGPDQYLSIDVLVRQLLVAQSDPERYSALSALGRFGPESREAVPVLIDVLRQPRSNPQVRILTVWVLGQIGPAARAATPDLLVALNSDPYLSVRAHAAQALGKIGADSPAVTAALIRGLGESNSNLRGACVIAVWRIGPPASPAIPNLRRILRDPAANTLERYFAAGALSAMGQAAAPAVPEISPLLFDRNPDVRYMAAYAVGRIEVLDETTLQSLRRVAADPNEEQRVRAAANNTLSRLLRRRRLATD